MKPYVVLPFLAALLSLPVHAEPAQTTTPTTSATSVEAYTLEVQVLREIGTPLAGVAVEISQGPTRTAETDSQGKAKFFGLIAGEYTVSVHKESFQLTPSDVNIVLPTTTGPGAPNGRLDFTAKRTAFNISGTVVNGACKPVKGQQLELRINNNVLVTTAVTDANGKYLFKGLAPETYTVIPTAGAGLNFEPGQRLVTLATRDLSFSPDGRADFVRTIGNSSPYNVVFESNKGGSKQIYFLSPGSTAPKALTIGAENRCPHFSTNGKKILFDSTRDGGRSIFIMNADGTGAARLTSGSGADQQPAPSPDGRSIAWSRVVDMPFRGLWTAKADGSNPQSVKGGRTLNDHPSWSPNGKRIALHVTEGLGPNIFTINSDGGNSVQLTSTETDQDPNFSPNGKQIVFSSSRDGNNEIYVMDADGTHVTRLTENGDNDIYPTWSPDGKYIFFSSNRSGNYDIYRMLYNGTEVVQVTSDPADETWPTVGPVVPNVFTVSGKVTNPRGAFIKGVIISLVDENGILQDQSITGPEGNYFFGGISTGPYRVQAHATEGYFFSPASVPFELPTAGKTGSPNAVVNFIRQASAPTKPSAKTINFVRSK